MTDRDTFAAAALLAFACAGCGVSGLVNKPTEPRSHARYVEYPKLSAHCRGCPQCSKPLMNDDGTENSICEEGFRLMQEDMKERAKQ